MHSLPTILRTLAPRLVAVVLLLGLALGGRAGTFINTCVLKAAPATAQAPVEEEEEHRHEAKGNAAASDRRQRDPVPSPKLGDGDFTLMAWPQSHGRMITPVRVMPDHESDLRNGIGAPLRC